MFESDWRVIFHLTFKQCGGNGTALATRKGLGHLRSCSADGDRKNRGTNFLVTVVVMFTNFYKNGGWVGLSS